MDELSCKWQDDEPFPFPLILSDNNISSSLLITPTLLFTLRPTLSTLTVGVFCYQCFEHSSHQWICRYSRSSAGSRGEYWDKRWGEATHKTRLFWHPLLYLISYMIFYSTLSHFILLYSIQSNPFQFYSTVLYSILLYSTLSYSIRLYSILLYPILLYSILFYSILFYSTLSYSILFYSFSLYNGNTC